MSGRTRPDGYQIIQDMGDKQRPKGYRASAPFVTSISVLLGVIIAVGMILGVVGDAFYVTRHEYTDKNLKDAETTTTFQQTLNQLKETMTIQATNFKEMSGKMEDIRVEISSRRK